MDLKEVGQRIKDLRLKQGMSQNDLAEKIMITPQAISKWERGISLPDVLILQQLSEIFGVNISYILTGDEKAEISVPKKRTSGTKKIIISLIVVVIIVLGLYLIFSRSDYNFKTISSACKDFDVTGSVAYDNNKTSIYISDVKYCGKRDSTQYKKIECTLYESYKDTETKISVCDNGTNTNLINYLDKLKINVDKYNYSCREFSKSKLYLLINATDGDNKTTSYRIPLSLDNNCS